MRRLIPFYILAVLTIASGVFAFVSYLQANDPTSATMLLSCSNKYGGPPSTYVLACADYNAKVTDLHWTSWGNTTAYATGEARWNDCTPSCVSGHWKSEPVTVWAWDLKGNHYTRLGSTDPLVLPSVALKPYRA
ncbi:MAG TPA: hypothetical protein VGP11_01890 [Acidimicrobiales bacterium]|nr:hypothetical protein [Acidimicrobiales bacterium]